MADHEKLQQIKKRLIDILLRYNIYMDGTDAWSDHNHMADSLTLEVEEMVREEAERIFTQFCVASSALTMYQTNESIHWTAQELHKQMRRICGIDEIQANCEHEWKRVGSNNSMETFKATSWIYHCEKCNGMKEEAL